MFQNFVGTQLATADIAVGVAGKPTRVFAIHILSTGGGGAVVALRDGATVSGTIYVQETGTTSTGKTFIYGKYGMLFPDGCFCDVDANTTSVAIAYEQEA